MGINHLLSHEAGVVSSLMLTGPLSHGGTIHLLSQEVSSLMLTGPLFHMGGGTLYLLNLEARAAGSNNLIMAIVLNLLAEPRG
jgi:hypothetical protein